MIIVRKEQLGTDGKRFAYPGKAFTDLDAAPLEGLGHFPHREDPDRAAAEIAAWFSGP